MFEVTRKITKEEIQDLLTTAFEGGSNYWLKQVDSNLNDVGRLDALFEGGMLELRHIDGTGIVTTGDVQKGLDAMATKYPRHFDNIGTSKMDAVTADVFFQCCVFGRVVFG